MYGASKGINFRSTLLYTKSNLFLFFMLCFYSRHPLPHTHLLAYLCNARRRGLLCCNATASRKRARQSSCILDSPPKSYAFVLFFHTEYTQQCVARNLFILYSETSYSLLEFWRYCTLCYGRVANNSQQRGMIKIISFFIIFEII